MGGNGHKILTTGETTSFINRTHVLYDKSYKIVIPTKYGNCDEASLFAVLNAEKNHKHSFYEGEWS